MKKRQTNASRRIKVPLKSHPMTKAGMKAAIRKAMRGRDIQAVITDQPAKGFQTVTIFLADKKLSRVLRDAARYGLALAPPTAKKAA